MTPTPDTNPAAATFVEVALPLPVHRTFTYRASGGAAIGSRVLVPFRREERIGWVVDVADHSDVKGVKPVLAVLDEQPTVPPDLLELSRWIAEYYTAPLGIALRAALPSVLSDVSRDYVTLRPGLGAEVEEALRDRERRVVVWLRERGGPQRVRTLRRALDMGSVWPEVRSLSDRGVLTHETVSPPAPSVRKRKVVRVARELRNLAERDELFGRAGRQKDAYAFLEAAGGSADLKRLVGTEGFGRGVIKGLEEKGLVTLADEEEMRDPFLLSLIHI